VHNDECKQLLGNSFNSRLYAPFVVATIWTAH